MVSAITLLEIAVVFGKGATPGKIAADKILGVLDSHPAIHIAPLSIEVAAEVAALGDSLRDPADRAIVATARVSRVKLITSDRRIIDSELVPVVA